MDAGSVWTWDISYEKYIRLYKIINYIYI
jgi:hypothetical protein